MRVLCPLDGTNVEQVNEAIANLVASDNLIVSFLYVIDTRPQQNMERRTGPLMRRSRPDDPRFTRIQQVNEEVADEILAEAQVRHPGAEHVVRRGQPERVIVNYAAEWSADILVVCPRSLQSGGPTIGPKSLGHVARFVVDHAPCPVLLARVKTTEGFPLPEKR